ILRMPGLTFDLHIMQPGSLEQIPVVVKRAEADDRFYTHLFKLGKPLGCRLGPSVKIRRDLREVFDAGNLPGLGGGSLRLNDWDKTKKKNCEKTFERKSSFSREHKRFHRIQMLSFPVNRHKPH